MTSTDSHLGQRVHEHLLGLNLETPMIPKGPTSIGGVTCPTPEEIINQGIRESMRALGLDLSDDSLKGTPRRVAKMYAREIFYGLDYVNFPRCMTIENKMQYNEMVCSKNIIVRSMCEHHFVPFIGSCHVAYIPDKKVVGLSKLNRVVDFFSRRPQVQERLTEQVANTLSLILETQDVAVVVDCEHLCVKLRGVEDPHSSTVTSKLLGKFRSVDALRNEFLHIAMKA